MRARLKTCLKIGAAILGVGCAYALFCSLTGWGIPCPFYTVTGLNCPGCGVSRMLLSLLRLDFAAAFRYNAAVFCLLPVLLGLLAVGIWRFVRYGRRQQSRLMQGVELSLALVLMLWGVVRNFIGM